MREVAILSAVRTPIGRAPRGVFKNTRPDDLAALVSREAMRRAEVEPAVIEDVVLGCAHPEAEQGLNVARQVGFMAGLPDEVPAMTINRFCSSGLQSTAIVADRIAAGSIDAGLAGGLEGCGFSAEFHLGRLSAAAPVALWPRLFQARRPRRHGFRVDLTRRLAPVKSACQ